jgi:hypothetical protein
MPALTSRSMLTSHRHTTAMALTHRSKYRITCIHDRPCPTCYCSHLMRDTQVERITRQLLVYGSLYKGTIPTLFADGSWTRSRHYCGPRVTNHACAVLGPERSTGECDPCVEGTRMERRSNCRRRHGRPRVVVTVGFEVVHEVRFAIGAHRAHDGERVASS